MLRHRFSIQWGSPTLENCARLLHYDDSCPIKDTGHRASKEKRVRTHCLPLRRALDADAEPAAPLFTTPRLCGGRTTTRLLLLLLKLYLGDLEQARPASAAGGVFVLLRPRQPPALPDGYPADPIHLRPGEKSTERVVLQEKPAMMSERCSARGSSVTAAAALDCERAFGGGRINGRTLKRPGRAWPVCGSRSTPSRSQRTRALFSISAPFLRSSSRV